MITDVMSPGAITTGLVLITLSAFALFIWAHRGERDPGFVFSEPVTVPGPGRCGCGAPKCTPQAAPFPGEMLAAPVAEPEPEQDDDTVWRRHGIDDDVWARLRAEVTS